MRTDDGAQPCRRTRRWTHRLVGATAIGAVGLMLGLAAPAVANASASGSAQPRVVERSDDAEFTITCNKATAGATLTAVWLGQNKTPMIRVTPNIFAFDMIVPETVLQGDHSVQMVCSDGSTAAASIYVSKSHS